MVRTLTAGVAILLLSVFTTSAASAEEGAITGNVPSAGIGLVMWGGGDPILVPGAAARGGCDLTAFFLSQDGALRSWVVGAPSFVNADFSARVGASISPNTPIILVCSGKPATSPTAAPTSTPAATATPSAGGAQVTRARFDIFAAMAPLNDVEYQIVLSLTPGIPAPAPGDEAAIQVEFCFGTATTVGDCVPVDVELGRQRFRDTLPARRSDSLFLRMRVCGGGSCSAPAHVGIIAVEPTGAFYVVVSTSNDVSLIELYSLRSEAERITVTTSDRQSVNGVCSGIGLCSRVSLRTPVEVIYAQATIAPAGGTLRNLTFRIKPD